MAESPGQQNLDQLLLAGRTADSALALSVWRGLTTDEQEDVVLGLLNVRAATDPELAEPEGYDEDPVTDVGDTVTTAPVVQTELVPRILDDLRGLTASERDSDQAYDQPATSVVSPDYWARWLRRWKVSALVASWAVTTAFAFTTDTSAFGATEWVVALFGTVVLGGGLVGTLVNFGVAALPMPDSTEETHPTRE